MTELLFRAKPVVNKGGKPCLSVWAAGCIAAGVEICHLSGAFRVAVKQECVEICSAVERIVFKPKPSWTIVVALIFQYEWAFVLLHSGPVSLMVAYSRTPIQDGLLSLDWDLWMSRDSAADSVVQWYSLWPRCEILSIHNKNSITHTQHVKKNL